MKLFRTMCAAVLLVVGMMTATSATASGADRTYVAPGRHVPEAVGVPAGHRRVITLAGAGVQVYGCTAGAWTLVQPAAVLSRFGRSLGIHGKGPVWTSTVDGSTVGALAVASVPRPGTIPLLLLKANLNNGDGVFGNVSYVQRLNTRGGVAPAGSCLEGAQTAVQYTADYVFWVAV